ncbi:MAG: PRD domain-containing protein [Enterobacterales bacterium endosymbiont of Blomia tropicalis]|uniref:BglG family transcription antiterminator n=1 Tax=Mixta mediterraneensis TaxID=2758443 RepID=UPI0025A782EE|nr:PRD domain-containing protein [Mixta mediterraneensis]MDL4913984.1 PRD domain-containing protein [Mixta mediterraneensis]
MQKLTSRQYRLLKLLLQHSAPLALPQLAHQLDVSEKSIYRDLQNIEPWLTDWHIVLEKLPGRSLRLHIGDMQQRTQLEQRLTSEENWSEGFSNNARRVKIASQLLSEAPRETSISKLSERYFISHASIVNDLKVIEEWLQPLDLLLVRSQSGTHVEGSEQALRQAMVSLINDVMQHHVASNTLEPRLDPGSYQALIHYFGEQDVAFVQALLQQMEQQLSYPLSDAYYINLCMHILIMMHRMAQGNALSLPAALSSQELDSRILLIARQMVTRIEQRIQAALPADEVGFIYQYIVSSGIVMEEHGNETPTQYQFSSKESLKITNELIHCFSELIQRDLSQDRLLFEGLLIHIKPLINRLKYHIHIRNPLLDDIKNELSEIFSLTQRAMCLTAKRFQLSPVADDEVGYLCVHFQAALERQIAHKRILVVCSSGVGTSHLLKSRILRAFPDWIIVGVVSASNMSRFCQQETVDLVITTIHLEANALPMVYVTAFFNDDDIRRVTEAMIGSQLPHSAHCAMAEH